ncbi:ROK family transcriptional regulator [Aliagarivorans taiwanensis]|uniref:ROK family transcriptional regulator n=1 Tax=Aliagarivorans taiwanensis TaxID=561966 RepID=UPI00041A99B8|nr:ROK family transcriptional regulator [Aliagarivorans taiwanensis]
MKKQIVNVDHVKQVNSATVYRIIDQQGPISRIQVAEQTQLAPASVTKITRQLLAKKLIKEVAQQASTGGRRAISLMVEEQAFHFVSLKLGRGCADIGLFTLGGSLAASEHLAFDALDDEPVADELTRLLKRFIQSHAKSLQLIAIAVTLSGLVNPGEGLVVYTPHYRLRNYPLAQRLQNVFSLPVYLGNDTRAAALAEHYYGATKDSLDSVLISVHGGTSAGIIINGEVFMSQHRDVGEIGHIQIDPFGKKCHCGNIGCLETLVSNPAIIEQVETMLTQGSPSSLSVDELSIESICNAANEGDLVARQVLVRTGQMLGRAIAIMINLFHPQKVVLTGELMCAKEIVLDSINQCVEHQALASFRDNLPIVQAEVVDQPAWGGVALVKRALLNGELLQTLLNSDDE